MAAVRSSMLSLGTVAPDFSLRDVATGRVVSLGHFADQQALLVIFLCAHCPYVVHVAPELARLGSDYADQSVGIVGITANDIEAYPQDAPKPTAEFARRAGFRFPIIFDETQAAALAYTAACTPDFFLFGPDRALVYRGQLDDSRPARTPERPATGSPSGADLRAALGALLAGRPVNPNQLPSIGCSIKWKPGNEPAC